MKIRGHLNLKNLKPSRFEVYRLELQSLKKLDGVMALSKLVGLTRKLRTKHP